MILPNLPMHLFAIACLIAVGAGIVKGAVGFGMPMLMISGLTTILPPELALAGLIVPTVVTNWMQVFRNGWRMVIQTIKRFRLFLAVGGMLLFASAQLVPNIPAASFILAIGTVVTGFAIWQLSGLAPEAGRFQQTRNLDIAIGAFVGFIGGLSGVWGPPTVAYLTAIGTEKRMQMLVQGVIYGLGAIVLFGAHVRSGVMNWDTLPLSLALLPAAMLGMWIGGLISDRFDQATFRKATLVVLVFGGLNLVRRGLLG